MTAKEIVQTAMIRARLDLLEDMRTMEFVYSHPRHTADDDMVGFLVESAFSRLIGLCANYRKGQMGESDRCIVLGEDKFSISPARGRHVVSMKGYSQQTLRRIPEDMYEILEEFHTDLADRRAMAERIVAEYWAMRKAGDIAHAAVSAQLGTYLKDNGMDLIILVTDDGSWRCYMHSGRKEKTISFLSVPTSVIDDIKRVSGGFC
jgi:hypothetical protein